MSAHIVWDPFLMPANSTPASTISTIKSRLQAGGWQVVREDASAAYVDVVPPSTQEIGGNGHREVLRIYAPAGGNTLQLWSYMETTIARRHQFLIRASLYYTSSYNSYFAANNRILVDGVPIVGASSGLSTADATLEAFYNVLANSSQAEAQLFDWSYSKASAADFHATITATAKAAGPHTITLTSVAQGRPAVIGSRDGASAGSVVPRTLTQCLSLTVDYTYGFVIYLEQMARTLQIGIRTNSAFSGPAAATWVDHASALAATPSGCSPIELVVADLTTSGTSGGTLGRAPATVTHLWGIVPWASYYDEPERYAPSSLPYSYPPSDWRSPAAAYMTPASIYGGANREGAGILEDTLAYRVDTVGYVTRMISAAATVAGILDGTATDRRHAVLGSPMISRLSLTAQQSGAIYVNACGTGSTALTHLIGAYVLPGLPLHDVYAFPGSATNESIHLAEHETVATTLVTALDGSSDYSTVELADAGAFPSAGAAICGAEKFTWTGKSGNILSGVTRAQYGTTKAVHGAGSTVKLGTWFIRLNGAAIPVGTTKPTA